MAAPSSIQHVTDHAQQAVLRLLQQFRDGVSMPAFAAIIGARAQILEDALWSVLTQRFFSGNPVGQQLDNLGKIVNLPRGNMSDAAYTRFLQVQVLVNRSSGSIPHLDAIFQVASDPGSTVAVQEFFPANIVVLLGGVAQEQPNTLFVILQQAKAAGVLARLVYNTDTDANSFTLEPIAGYLQAGIGGGATSLNILDSVSSASNFPVSGSITLGFGTAVQETVAYSAVNVGTGIITCSATANAHSTGEAVALVGSSGLGFDTTPSSVTSGSSSPGGTTLAIVSGGLSFAASGLLVINKGTQTEEMVAYSSRTSTVFTLVGTLQQPHASGEAVQTITAPGGLLTGAF